MPVITRKMSRENREHHYPRGTQEKYNNFQSRITERQGGGKGEPRVPPIHEKGYFIYRNVCPEIASPRILGSIKLRADKLARPIFNNGSNKKCKDLNDEKNGHIPSDNKSIEIDERGGASGGT